MKRKSKVAKSKPALKVYARAASEGRSLGARASGAASARRRAMALGYTEQDVQAVPPAALEMSMGCGNPLALADLKRGQTVLDLGSGGGLDALLAARRVGPEGKVIGVDATAEMVEKAKAFAAGGGFANVDFRAGRLEELPLEDESVDAVVSNCVLNHSADKPAVFREAFRVLRRGGRILLADLLLEGPAPKAGGAGLEIWKEWLATAWGKRAYLGAMADAGFRRIAVLREQAYAGPAMAKELRGKILSVQIRAEK